MANTSSPNPSSQLSSRGRRKPPVKNTRARWATMTATNTTAVQWWIWRIRSPAWTSNERCSTESKACRDRGALERRVRARVDRPAAADGHEEEREERAGREEDQEAEQRDLAQQERPVVGEHLAQGRPHEARRGRSARRASDAADSRNVRLRRVVARRHAAPARLVGGAAEIDRRAGCSPWLIRRCRRSCRSGRMHWSGRASAPPSPMTTGPSSMFQNDGPTGSGKSPRAMKCRRPRAGSAAAAAVGRRGRTSVRRRA